MKIIDLYNDIANNKPIPELIRWNGEFYKKFKIGSEYMSIIDGELFFKNLDTSILNDEIEVIDLEEIGKIQPLDIRQEKNIKNNWKWVLYGPEHKYNIATPYKIMADKINELIKEINELKEK